MSAILPTPSALECALPFAVVAATAITTVLSRRPRIIAATGLLAGALAAWALAGRGPVVVHGTWFVDDLGVLSGCVALLALAASVVLGGCRAPAALASLVVAGLGAWTASVAHDLLVLLGGLTITHLGLVGAGHRADRDRALAAGRHAILGAALLATAWVGAAFLIAGTGSTAIAADVEQATLWGRAGATVIALALAGLVGAVPLHAWLGHGARAARPTALGATLAVMPLAALVPLLRVLASPTAHHAAPALPTTLAAIAALSLVFGALINVVAVSARAWLASACVVHAGIALGALAIRPVGGAEAATFHAIAFATAAIASAAMLRVVGRDPLATLHGLGRAHPLRATALAFSFAAAIGAPGTAAFPARLAVLRALHDGGAGWLVAIAVLATVVPLVGLVVLVRDLFLVPPSNQWDDPPAGACWIAGIALALVATIGFWPDAAFDTVRAACRALHATALR